MTAEDVRHDLPEEVVYRVIADVRCLSGLSGEKRTALFGALTKFQPSTLVIATDETQALATSVNVDVDVVRSAISLAYLLRERNQVGSLSGAEFGEAVRPLLVEAGFSEATSLLTELAPVTAALDRGLARVRRLESTMPSLIEGDVACDLRYLSGEKPGEFELAPMAIVRLVLDDVDDAVFHCSPASLKRLITTLEDASRTLETLTEIAQQAGVMGGGRHGSGSGG